MHILIIGAAGMVGRKLTAGLAKAGQVGGKEIVKLTLADVIKPEPVPLCRRCRDHCHRSIRPRRGTGAHCFAPRSHIPSGGHRFG